MVGPLFSSWESESERCERARLPEAELESRSDWVVDPASVDVFAILVLIFLYCQFKSLFNRNMELLKAFNDQMFNLIPNLGKF